MKKQNTSNGAFKRLAAATGTSATGAMTGTLALALTLFAGVTQAQVTQDCILEGTVDMRKAEHLGQPVYVRFEDIRAGSEGTCSMDRRSRSRRVQFVSSTELRPAENVEHGSRVHYRYVERDGEPGNWELIKVGDPGTE